MIKQDITQPKRDKNTINLNQAYVNLVYAVLKNFKKYGI